MLALHYGVDHCVANFFYATACVNYGTFVPNNFRPQGRKFHRVELSFPGTFVPWNVRPTFVPGDKNSWRMLSTVYLLTYKKVTFNNGVSFMQTNISLSFTVISE